MDEASKPAPTEPPVVQYATVAPRRRLRMPDVALMLGVLSLPGCLINVLLAPVAIILGIIALRRARHNPEVRARRWRAVCGIAVAIVSLTVLVWAVEARRTQYGPWGIVVRLHCEGRLLDVGTALRAYAADNGGAFPTDLTLLCGSYLDWVEFLRIGSPYSDTVNSTCDWDYVLGPDTSAPGDWIVAYGDPKLFNGEGGPILYVDGTVKLLKRPEFDAEWRRFMQDYERVRGAPPIILPAR